MTTYEKAMKPKRKLDATRPSSSSTLSVSLRKATIDDINVFAPTSKIAPTSKKAKGKIHPNSLITPSTAFPSKLLPFPISEFLTTHFRKQVVYINNNSTPFTNLSKSLCGLNPLKIFSETSSENVFIWIKYPINNKLKSIEIEDPVTAAILHENNHASYCRAPPQFEQALVSNFLGELGIGGGQYDASGGLMGTSGLEGRGEVEVFIGVEGHYTDWHFDFQENFSFQLSGSKRWRFKQGSVTNPLRGATPHYMAPSAVESQLKSARISTPTFEFRPPYDSNNAKSSPEISDFTEIVMKPGDFMYFPAGMWHSVETVSAGVSINVSLMGSNYADLYCSALKHVLLMDDKWRGIVMDNLEDGEDGKGRAVNVLKGLVDGMGEKVKLLTASMILPPVATAKLETKEDGGNGSEESDDEEEEDMDEDEKGFEEVSGHDDEGEGEGEEEDMDDTNIINLQTHLEAEIPLEMKDVKSFCDLIANPLALVLVEEEVLQYYKLISNLKEKENKKVKDGNDDTVRFIYNLNYAGNDSQTSAVRKVLSVRKSSITNSVLSDFVQSQRQGTYEEWRRRYCEGGGLKSPEGVNAVRWLHFLGAVVKR